jgi:hypothetical protein
MELAQIRVQLQDSVLKLIFVDLLSNCQLVKEETLSHN